MIWFCLFVASLLVCLPHLCESPRAQSRERLWRASRLPRIVIAISPRKRQTLLSTAKSTSVLNRQVWEIWTTKRCSGTPCLAVYRRRGAQTCQTWFPEVSLFTILTISKPSVGAKSQLAKGRNSASPYIAMQSPCLQIRQRHCYAIQVHILGPRAKLVQCTLLLARRNCYQGPNMDQQHRHS